MVSQFWIDWLTAILFGALLVLELAFLPETLYPRKQVLRLEAHAGPGLKKAYTSQVQMKRTAKLPFINLRPIPGIRHPGFMDAIARFGLTFKYPVLVLSVGIFCFSWYWWILSIVTQIPAAYAQYSPSTQGLLFLGLLIGSWFAELFCSGRLSDWLVERLSKSHGGIRVPETRLWLAYPAVVLSSGEFSAPLVELRISANILRGSDPLGYQHR